MPYLLQHIIELVWAMILLILTGTSMLISIKVCKFFSDWHLKGTLPAENLLFWGF